ncbi:ribonuclease P protein subunit p20-like [Oppia nitens]|uniref:ribonuclease P protein subunit p20-like n=1 Tax=Oppia nitens TaxID=1686743 RepID=UPI0023DA8ED3|nr:ribonuclease P protein subunit p20-like [Oppia nitens]
MDKTSKDNKDMAKSLRVDKEEYVLRKRLATHLPKQLNHFNVNMKTNFGVQLKRCQQTLDTNCDHIVIHGLAKAVNRAINMALQLQQSNHLEISCTTSSVDMMDDFEPIGHNRDINESFTQKRTVSAIHIKLYRKSQLNK